MKFLIAAYLAFLPLAICAEGSSARELHLYKKFAVSDGIVFIENDDIFLIEPLRTHYVDKEVEIVGYTKGRIRFIANDSKAFFYTGESVVLQQNELCPECSSLYEGEINQFEFAKSKTSFPLLFERGVLRKAITILDNQKMQNVSISLRVDTGDFGNEILLTIKDSTGNLCGEFIGHGSLMFLGTFEKLFYMGINNWGGSGHTGYVYFWEIG